jgi:hypothetical protein
MADWVWGTISAFASLPVFAGFVVVSLIFIFVLFPLTKRAYPKIRTLDADPWGFSVRDADYTLGLMDETQLKAYRKQELFTDMLFPAVYGIGFAVAMVLLARYTGAPRWLVLLPIIVMLADYVENFSILSMIGNRLRGQAIGGAAPVGSVASRIKHFLLAATLLVLLGLCAYAVWRRFSPPTLN